jgi:hypothetical protein
LVLVTDVLKNPKYLLIAILSSIGMALIYAYTQVLGVVSNLELWIMVMPWYNKLLFAIFSCLFGVVISFQLYLLGQPKACSLSKTGGSVGANSGATFAVFLVAQCPACASIGAFFLPVSAVILIGNFGWAINLVGIAMMLFMLRYLGGFRRK